MNRIYSSVQVARPFMNTGLVRQSPTAQKTVVLWRMASMWWWLALPLRAQDLRLAVYTLKVVSST